MLSNACLSSHYRMSSSIGAAAAKLLQSCPTLCDPIDGSPPGSPVLGILQARTLEWDAISFSSAWKWKVKVKSLSRVLLFAIPWTAAYQAPPSMGFSRQECWSGVLLPSWTLIIHWFCFSNSFFEAQLTYNIMLIFKYITKWFDICIYCKIKNQQKPAFRSLLHLRLSCVQDLVWAGESRQPFLIILSIFTWSNSCPCFIGIMKWFTWISAGRQLILGSHI